MVKGMNDLIIIMIGAVLRRLSVPADDWHDTSDVPSHNDNNPW